MDTEALMTAFRDEARKSVEECLKNAGIPEGLEGLKESLNRQEQLISGVIKRIDTTMKEYEIELEKLKKAISALKKEAN